jgi:ubiquinone biosynthesis protein Coq4
VRNTIAEGLYLLGIGLAVTALIGGIFGNLALYQVNRHEDIQKCIKTANSTADAHLCYHDNN